VAVERILIGGSSSELIHRLTLHARAQRCQKRAVSPASLWRLSAGRTGLAAGAVPPHRSGRGTGAQLGLRAFKPAGGDGRHLACLAAAAGRRNGACWTAPTVRYAWRANRRSAISMLSGSRGRRTRPWA
jgi:hypothetical protein